MKLKRAKWIVVTAIATTQLMTQTALAADAPAEKKDDPTRMPEVKVVAPKERGGSLPSVEGAKIYEGKKTTVAESGAVPTVVNNNLRQAFTQLPGLLVSESESPGHSNLNYRGIGDPHESEFVLTLKDGIPIGSDWFGYPTFYYTPAMESVARTELIRGGSALLYGPQPGPVVNFVTYRPPTDRKFSFQSENVAGSHGFFSTYNSIGGTVKQLGYHAWFQHRQSDGPRENSDYMVNNGSFKLLLAATPTSRWILAFDGYASENGEAGRLTTAQYAADRNTVTKPFDRLWVDRFVPSLTYENELSEQSFVTVKTWGGYQDRFSRRQSGAFANIDRQEFYFFGADARVRHFWETGKNEHAFTGGAVFYKSDSPRTRHRGATPLDTTGALRFEMERSTLYGAVFAENKFQFGRLAVVPAARLELLEISAKEIVNVERVRPLIDDTFSAVVPLFGIGFTYDLCGKSNSPQFYANVSQGYRPPKYDDIVNPTAEQFASSLDEGRTWNVEAGVRGAPTAWFRYDAGVFYTDFDNFIENLDLGGGDTTRVNSGRAEFFGYEISAETDLIGLYDALAKTEHGKKIGSLTLFANVQLLDADFVSGRNMGRTPAYAPDCVIKGGVVYRKGDRAKVAFTGVFVDEHFWQDSNGAGAVGTDRVAAYSVWDLTAEVKVIGDTFTIIGGINNVFDHDYYSRIRSDGIEPAARRNFYAGFKIRF